MTQPFWDNLDTLRRYFDPGDTVVFECAEPVEQLTPDSSSKDLKNIDFSLPRKHPARQLGTRSAEDTLEELRARKNVPRRHN